MKLTSSHRIAFVAAVLNDIPQIDYQQEAKKLVDAYFAARCHEDVVAFEKKYPGRIRQFYVAGPNHTSCHSAFVDCAQHNLDSSHPDLYAQLSVISADAEVQYTNIKAVREKLTASIKACSTVKHARERLPEFEKYLPFEAEPTKDLPAVANLVADLAKLGWPKSDRAESEV